MARGFTGRCTMIPGSHADHDWRRADLYKTQHFDGGVYTAYRTDYRDIVVGVDALWINCPSPTLR